MINFTNSYSILLICFLATELHQVLCQLLCFSGFPQGGACARNDQTNSSGHIGKVSVDRLVPLSWLPRFLAPAKRYATPMDISSFSAISLDLSTFTVCKHIRGHLISPETRWVEPVPEPMWIKLRFENSSLALTTPFF